MVSKVSKDNESAKRRHRRGILIAHSVMIHQKRSCGSAQNSDLAHSSLIIRRYERLHIHFSNLTAHRRGGHTRKAILPATLRSAHFLPLPGVGAWRRT